MFTKCNFHVSKRATKGEDAGCIGAGVAGRNWRLFDRRRGWGKLGFVTPARQRTAPLGGGGGGSHGGRGDRQQGSCTPSACTSGHTARRPGCGKAGCTLKTTEMTPTPWGRLWARGACYRPTARSSSKPSVSMPTSVTFLNAAAKSMCLKTGIGIPSDCKHQSVPNKHGHCVDRRAHHTACGGGVELKNREKWTTTMSKLP